jgi:hypothetical protein
MFLFKSKRTLLLESSAKIVDAISKGNENKLKESLQLYPELLNEVDLCSCLFLLTDMSF